MSLRAALVVGALLATPAAARAQQPAPDTLLTRTLTEAYEAVRAGDAPRAARLFRSAEAHAPRRADIPANLGYALLRMDSVGAAILAFRRSLAFDHTNDEIGLQLAYLVAAHGRPAEARARFADLTRSPDPSIAERARAAAANVGEPTPRFVELYAAPLFQGRFDAVIVPVLFRAGVQSGGGRAQLYGSLRVARDSRSEVGTNPQIVSDNVAIPGLGVRLRVPGLPVSAYAEGGWAFALIRDVAPGSGGDLRAGLIAAAERSWGPGGRARAELYGDAGWYSRYDDGIGTLEVRAGWDLAAERRARAFATLRATADTDGRFFNNVGEAGLGLEAALERSPLTLRARAEYLRGRYLRGRGPYAPTYSDLRITLIAAGFRAW